MSIFKILPEHFEDLYSQIARRMLHLVNDSLRS